MYSTKSELTQYVCKVIGFRIGAGFVETAKRNGKIYVRGTVGKPEEFRQLKRLCRENGFMYRGLFS